MRKYIITILIVPVLFLTSCDLLKDSSGLSSSQIVDGLKTALTVGTDSSSKQLSATNGFYGNALLKIGFPPEAQAIIDCKDNSYFKAAGVSTLIDSLNKKVILSINRAAEDAADTAAPIFKKAITNLSITDGLSILQGVVPTTTKAGTTAFDSTAATQYLKSQTYTSLTSAFSSPINASLNKDLGLGFTTTQLWSTLIGYYNQGVLANNAAYDLKLTNTKLNGVTVDLGTYCTQKALDGLFYKVGTEEKAIRGNPYNWTLDILRKVFGSGSK